MDNIICGFGINNKLTENDYSLTYTTVAKEGCQPTLIKIHKSAQPSVAEQDAFQNEYDLLHYLNQPLEQKTVITHEASQKDKSVAGIIQIYGLEKYNNTSVLLFEDIGGKSLANWLKEQQFSVQDILYIGVKLCSTLEYIHSKYVFHKHINLNNIIWNKNTDQLRIIDYSQASRFQTDSPFYSSFTAHQPSYVYMSPEQTGRINRSIDYRSDFYSLGVCLFKLLLGYLSSEVSDLTHIQTALQVEQSNSQLPRPVLAIIMKLLEQEPDKRYQSARGLVVDLQYCIDNFVILGTKKDFIPGLADISRDFIIPQKLFGRDNEIATLNNALERIGGLENNQRTQKVEMILISGYSGIGKSALIREMSLPLAEKQGYFISGKYDQFQRNIPYSALVSGFGRLVQQMLIETSENLQTWKQKLQDALGYNGQVIVDVIPEIELIIGKQKPLTRLGGSESQNRFNLIFQKFIQIFCDHPLVIFLDDLQWVDRASLKLLELLMEENNSSPLLIIGAYRDNEVTPTHPLMMMLDNLYTLNHNVKEINLRPLPRMYVNRLIADSLHQPPQAVSDLTDFVLKKTAGNPFFVNQLLHALYEEGLFTLNNNSSQASWNWDIEKIKQFKISDNVVDLMVAKLKKLPDSAQKVIQLSACIGNQFELNTLAIISQKELKECYKNLLPILTEGLIKVTEELIPGSIRHRHFFFLHDQVQQAAYALFDERQKKQIHLQISRLLLKNIISEETLEEHIFALLEQYNHCYELVSDQKERNKIARLNLLAGRKAKTATAYDAAANFLNIGIQCLSEQAWQSQYPLTIALASEAVEVEYLNTNYQHAENLAEEVIRRANTMLDKSRVYETQIHSFIAQNKMQQALDLGLDVLHLLGISLIQESPKIENIEKLSELPDMQVEDKLAAMRILNAIASPAYLVSSETYPFICYTSINMCLEYGNSRLAPNAYAIMSLICCGTLDDFERGYRYSQVAEQVMLEYDAKEIEAKVLLISNACVSHWQKPLRNSLEPLHDATYKALENGDVEYACYAAIYYCVYSFQSGLCLDEVRQRLDKYINLMVKLKQQYQTQHTEIWAQLVDNLCVPRSEPTRLVGYYFDEENQLPELIEANYISSLFCAYYAKVRLAYVFKNFSEALKNVKLAGQYLLGVVALNHFASFHFYSALVYLALYPSANKRQQEYLTIISHNLDVLKRRAKYAPMNFQHKVDLLEAEKARVLGKLEAVDWYEKAIRGAQENGFVHEEALAYELAAEYYLARDMGKFAKTYLLEAHYTYQQWGARVKVISLEKQYPQLFTRNTSIADIAAEATNSALSCRLDSTTWMDLNCVMKAYETLSEEIVLSGLLEKLMHLVIENAGAEKGFLLLPKEQDWHIEAQGDMNSADVQTMQSIALTDSEQISQTIVNYVSRSKEYVVLGNASKRGLYTMDKYIINNNIRSVLCIPLLKQGNLSAILYLENNLAEDVFTRDRVDLLLILSSQLAISIENSLLYSQLQEEIQLHKHTNEELHMTLDSLQKTQVQLIYSEKMAALGDLVAGIAHEINTPIGIGVTAVSHLEQRVKEMKRLLEKEQLTRSIFTEFADDASQTTQIVHNNLNRAAQLIKSFKLVAVDQSCEQERSFNLNDYIHEVLTSLQPKLKKTKHIIDVVCPNDLNIYSQPGAFSQIITNLVMNSLIHAYDENVYGNLKFVVAYENDCLNFAYSDDGKGMDKDIQKKTFEPFFTTQRQKGGSGLGMHIVYNLVTHALKGQIVCESALGKGTLFKLELPVKLT